MLCGKLLGPPLSKCSLPTPCVPDALVMALLHTPGCGTCSLLCACCTKIGRRLDTGAYPLRPEIETLRWSDAWVRVLLWWKIQFWISACATSRARQRDYHMSALFRDDAHRHKREQLPTSHSNSVLSQCPLRPSHGLKKASPAYKNVRILHSPQSSYHSGALTPPPCSTPKRTLHKFTPKTQAPAAFPQPTGKTMLPMASPYLIEPQKT